MGSILAARRAGMNPAIAATNPSSKITAIKESGSVLFNPNKKLCNTRVLASARGIPISKTDCYQQHGLATDTSSITSPRRAPSAMRRPTSRVRPATVYDITP